MGLLGWIASIIFADGGNSDACYGGPVDDCGRAAGNGRQVAVCTADRSCVITDRRQAGRVQQAHVPVQQQDEVPQFSTREVDHYMKTTTKEERWARGVALRAVENASKEKETVKTDFFGRPK